MTLESTRSNIRFFPQADRSISMEPAPYRAFVAKLEGQPFQSLRLVIDSQQMVNHANGKHLLEALVKELGLWSQVIGKRRICSVYIFHPFRLFEPFELTRFMHALASHFHLPARDKKFFNAVFELADVTSDHLALVKGLGFNNVQMMLSQAELNELECIDNKTTLIRDYALDSVGIQLHHPDCLSTIAHAIHDILSRCRPDYFCIGHTWRTFDVMGGEASSLERDLSQQAVDVLELGPAATSEFYDLSVETYCAVEKYIAATERGILPIHIPTPAP